MIEPVSEALTTSSMPARSATRAMISSGVAQRGVEEAADPLADPGRELLGREAEQAGQRHDGDAGQHEHQQRVSGRAWCSQAVTGTASSSHARGASARMLRIVFIAVPR